MSNILCPRKIDTGIMGTRAFFALQLPMEQFQIYRKNRKNISEQNGYCVWYKRSLSKGQKVTVCRKTDTGTRAFFELQNTVACETISDLQKKREKISERNGYRASDRRTVIDCAFEH